MLLPVLVRPTMHSQAEHLLRRRASFANPESRHQESKQEEPGERNQPNTLNMRLGGTAVAGHDTDLVETMKPVKERPPRSPSTPTHMPACSGTSDRRQTEIFVRPGFTQDLCVISLNLNCLHKKSPSACGLKFHCMLPNENSFLINLPIFFAIYRLLYLTVKYLEICLSQWDRSKFLRFEKQESANI
uniref:Uncharacterized protein n=1 Tax=Seriola dumerili TaxID=41447 RepID=A0A3B4URP8_SERDU